MSSLGSTTAATPALSSPIRYDAQPRSSCVTCRKSTRPSLGGRAPPALGGQGVAALHLEEVHLAGVHPEAPAAAGLHRARRLEPQHGLVLLERRQVGAARVGR